MNARPCDDRRAPARPGRRSGLAAASLLAALAFAYLGRHASPPTTDPGAPAPASSSEARFAEPWEKEWGRLVASSEAVGEEPRLLALLDELAARDPLRALEFADTADTRAARLRRRHAVLARWAQTEPHAAADWITQRLTDDPDARDAALAAVIAGVSTRLGPEESLALLRRLETEYPDGAEAWRGELVAAWTRNGAFDHAVEFASGVGREERADLLDATFDAWVRLRPASAARAALNLPDRDAREQAWRSVVAGWATTDPAALARYAAALPQAPARAEALGQALPHWFLRNPGEATAWMDSLPPSAELDPGAACVAAFDPLVKSRPDIALGWAESIVNSDLRRRTMDDIVRTWLARDPEAARLYSLSQGWSAADL